jgi:hypothetical protein
MALPLTLQFLELLEIIVTVLETIPYNLTLELELLDFLFGLGNFLSGF